MLILASTSPHRLALLKRLGLAFTQAAPQVDESERPGEAPWTRASRLAEAKASAVFALHPGAVVIGGDQVASLIQNNLTHILHKPGNRARCATQLETCSEQRIRFDTAITVVGPGGMRTHVDLTWVKFRPLSSADIERYMDREPAFDCAGGFKCEGLGVTLLESIETQDPTALVGIPLIWLCAALRQAGLAV
jgi:septum formation protein